ncbi:MAG: hypothetical protein Unbinned3325contig1000_49 [Prokaryotic dsDNA virus sp.]|nr:MAG: hypothetical protein Unbinned3325contig1000_49 [Prokaryotic dsDNA virus sp.]
MFGSMGQTNVKNLGNGGTMDGDVTITGDLTVSGGISLTLNEVLQGTSTIDVNNTEALLVRKDSDSGDVFIVDTTNTRVGLGNTPEVNFHIKLSDTANARIEDTSSDGIAKLDFKNDARQATIGVYGDDSDNFKIDHGGGTVITIDVGQVTTFAGDVKLSKASGATTQSFVPASGQSSQIKFMQDDGSTQDARIFAPEGVAKLAFEAGTTEMMRMSSTGIGIGISTLETPFNITPRLQVEGTNASTSSISAFRNSNDAHPPYLLLGKSRGTSVNADTIVQDNDILGRIGFIGADGSNRFSSGAEIIARVNGTPGASDLPTELVFGTTADGGTTPTERMSISSAGNVTMSGTLTVNGDLAKVSGSHPALQLEDSDDSNFGEIGYSDGVLSFTTNGGDEAGASDTMVFYNHGSTQRMKLLSNGSLQIGTASNTTDVPLMVNNKILIHQDSGGAGDSELTFDRRHDGAVARIQAKAGASGAMGTELHFVTKLAGGSEGTALVLDDNQKAGIGTATPDTLLHIFEADASQTATSEAQLTIENNGMAGINILSGTTSHGVIHFGNDGGNQEGRVGYDHGDDAFYVKVAGVNTKRIIIDTNSRISLSNNGGEATNTIFGYQAGNSIHASSGMNTFIGHQVADATMTADADENTAIGHLALSGLTEGAKNVAIGSYTGINITSGDENVLIGRSAGNNHNSSDLVGVGTATLASINSADADGSVAVGYNVLTALTSGRQSTGVGYKSLNAVTDGDNNTAFGYEAGLKIAGGSNNAVFGSEALKNEDGHGKNTAIGTQTLFALNAGADGHNTALGYQAGSSMNTGTSNTVIGSLTGDAITSGTNNVVVGKSSDISAVDGTNQIVIGEGATGVADNAVTLGNASVTAVYMAQDSGATVHCGGLKVTGDANGCADIDVGGSFVSVADDSTLTITSSVSSALLIMSEGAGARPAVFHLSYSSTPVLLSDPLSVYSTSDTDGKFCVIKSANDHATTFKNRFGSTRTFKFMLIGSSVTS